MRRNQVLLSDPKGKFVTETSLTVEEFEQNKKEGILKLYRRNEWRFDDLQILNEEVVWTLSIVYYCFSQLRWYVPGKWLTLCTCGQRIDSTVYRKSKHTLKKKRLKIVIFSTSASEILKKHFKLFRIARTSSWEEDPTNWTQSLDTQQCLTLMDV